MSLLGFLEHFSLGKADISQLEESVNKHIESVSRNIKIECSHKGISLCLGITSLFIAIEIYKLSLWICYLHTKKKSWVTYFRQFFKEWPHYHVILHFF